jgi:hypothetical protein
MIAEDLHRVAAFDERHALEDEALELDRVDFRAVLFFLAPPLRLGSLSVGSFEGRYPLFNAVVGAAKKWIEL